MRVGIIGANGQLGADLVEAFSRDHEVIRWTRKDFDILDHKRATEAILTARPDVVINTAAFHKTDACEDHPELAFATNVIAVRNIAKACEECRATLVQVSTDYVFGGEKGAPYIEDDPPHPINVYGTAKLAGEEFVSAICSRYYTIRVAGLFGLAAVTGNTTNFVEAMLRKASMDQEIRVVDDIWMSPTCTADAAVQIRRILEIGAAHGIYHVTNAGSCTWYDLARAALELEGVEARLQPWSIEEASLRAPRPRNSALASKRLGSFPLEPLRPWQEALQWYLCRRRELVPKDSNPI